MQQSTLATTTQRSGGVNLPSNAHSERHGAFNDEDYQEQWLDSTGPFKDVMISMFATLAKQERARISERTIAGLTVARAKGRLLGRPMLPEETVQKVLSLHRHAGIGARKIAKSTGFPLGTVNAILTRSRQQIC
jgi:DNA invertase Pin-like site-specific DNA recombinase